MIRVGVFGLGEAGSLIAADVAAAGAKVTGFDPIAHPPLDGVQLVDDPASAVAEADLVLAITGGADTMTALTQALDAIPRGVVYADFASASAQRKRELAGVAAGSGLSFADIALMSTVPGKGLATPALASGSGADAFVATMVPLGMSVEVVGDEPGVAATRKLLRSVVMKGLAGLVIESMRAANEAGLADETWQNLAHQFTVMDEAFLRRLVEGTRPHARRRLGEMEATAELLAELGVDPLMTAATVENLRQIPTEGLPPLPPA